MYNSRCIWFFDVLIIKCLKKYCFKNPAHFAYDTACSDMESLRVSPHYYYILLYNMVKIKMSYQK